MTEYIFKSARLGFREWKEGDAQSLAEINADKEVMEFFPRLLSEQETISFIRRMQDEYIKKGFCYFAVEQLLNQELIGFIGLSEQDFESDFTPCIDIGWRLKRSAWNKGYATEGAKACIHFAFGHLNIDRLYAIAPVVNEKSEWMMQKIGMKKLKAFHHPRLLGNERLRRCLLYEISRKSILPVE